MLNNSQPLLIQLREIQCFLLASTGIRHFGGVQIHMLAKHSDKKIFQLTSLTFKNVSLPSLFSYQLGSWIINFPSFFLSVTLKQKFSKNISQNKKTQRTMPYTLPSALENTDFLLHFPMVLVVTATVSEHTRCLSGRNPPLPHLMANST